MWLCGAVLFLRATHVRKEANLPIDEIWNLTREQFFCSCPPPLLDLSVLRSKMSKSNRGSEQDVGEQKVDLDGLEGNDATDLVRQYLCSALPSLTDVFQEAIGYQPVRDKSSISQTRKSCIYRSWHVPLVS